MYSEKTLENFYNPQNVGVIKGANGMGKVEDPTCGDIIKLYISVDEDDKVVDAKFQAFGCTAIIACGSVVTELIIGNSLNTILKITNKDILKELDGLPKNKEYCASIVEDAIKEAVEDFNRKQLGEKKPVVRKKKNYFIPNTNFD